MGENTYQLTDVIISRIISVTFNKNILNEIRHLIGFYILLKITDIFIDIVFDHTAKII
jgi:hypothetical protein